MDTSAVLRDFLVSRELTCRTSSLALYRHCLTSFETWIADQPAHATMPLAPTALGAYLTSLRARDLSDQTVRGHYRVLKTACRWLFEQDLLDRDPFSGKGKVSAPPLRRKRQEAYSDSDVTALLTCTAAINWKQDRRTVRQQWQAGGPLEREALQARALVLLLIDTALRAGEVCRMTCGDLRSSEVVVIGKGGHEGVIYLVPQVRLLLEYLALDRPDAAPLFRDWNGRACSVRALRCIVERLALRAEIDLPPRPLHAFRHAAARRWLKAGLPTLAIQQLMRHANVATTMIYCELDTAALAELHAGASPVSMLLARSGLTWL